ncbi:hypothetical protein ABZX77_00055 [Streptomyces sp. NPDC004237]|uniref:hypothetical protein n=1 Tax=Streptomyces sp. NPDC004237 TaxID=3154455 RepID=UPI0033BAEDF6
MAAVAVLGVRVENEPTRAGPSTAIGCRSRTSRFGSPGKESASRHSITPSAVTQLPRRISVPSS